MLRGPRMVCTMEQQFSFMLQLNRAPFNASVTTTFFNISPVIPAVHMQTECKTTKLDEYFTQINIIKSN